MFRRFSSTPATSMAQRVCASWACLTPSTTTARRSSDEPSPGGSGPMSITQSIKTLFASDINRRIEEVIKVDQTDEEILREEISEYVVTDTIRSHYTGILEAYRETPN